MTCKRSVSDEYPLCIQCGAPLQGPGSLPAVPVKPAAIVVPPRPPAPLVARPAGPDPHKGPIEAKARVLWGEERGAIRSDLIKQGHSWRDADRMLDDAFSERRAHFRGSGFRDLLLGAACIGGFLLVLGGLLLARTEGGIRFVYLGKGFLALFLLPPVGLFFAIRGISRLLGAGKGEGAATDLEEGD
jgi:hypothetical protein